MAATLRAKGADALLPAEVEVDEATADPPAVVEAELGLGDPRALVFQAGVFDIVVGALVAEPQAHGGLAHTVSVQHAFGAELVAAAVAIELEGKPLASLRVR